MTLLNEADREADRTDTGRLEHLALDLADGAVKAGNAAGYLAADMGGDMPFDSTAARLSVIEAWIAGYG